MRSQQILRFKCFLQLTKFSMRNLVRIKVGGNECTPTSVGSVLPSRDDNSSSEDSADETVAEKIVAKTKTPTVMPDNLSNYYAVGCAQLVFDRSSSFRS
jgi:hypothetical protein